MSQNLTATHEMSRGIPRDHEVALREPSGGREGRALHAATRTSARAVGTKARVV